RSLAPRRRRYAREPRGRAEPRPPRRIAARGDRGRGCAGRVVLEGPERAKGRRAPVPGGRRLEAPRHAPRKSAARTMEARARRSIRRPGHVGPRGVGWRRAKPPGDGSERDAERGQSAKGEALAELGRLGPEGEGWQPRDEGSDGDLALHASQGRAEAEVNAPAERDVP